MHTRRDVAVRVDRAALDHALGFVLEVVRVFDDRPERDASSGAGRPARR